MVANFFDIVLPDIPRVMVSYVYVFKQVQLRTEEIKKSKCNWNNQTKIND